MQDVFHSDDLSCILGESFYTDKDAKGKNITRELLVIHSDDEMDQPNTVVVYMQCSCSWEDNTKMKEQRFLMSTFRSQCVFTGLSRIVNESTKHREALAV